MTIEFQSSQPVPWYQTIRKHLQTRWLIGLLLLGGMTGGGLMLYRAIAPSQTAQSQMLTAPVERRTVPITFSANGTVKPERTINLSPKTAGYLKQLLVQEGDRVRQGQIIAYMDNSNLQGQLTQARAQLAQQEANRAQVDAAAIVRQQNGVTGVYVMGQDNQPVVKPIQIGTTVGDRTEVKSGLTGNERVLISFPPGQEPKSEMRGSLPGMGGNRNSSAGNRGNANTGNSAPPPPGPPAKLVFVRLWGQPNPPF